MADGGGAIGIFDSGVGGLTVLRRVVERLPHESTVYLGDTARVPYGTKSTDTVIRYALSCARLLVARRIKILIVACNTASSCALEPLREALDIPVLGVVEPGARAAAAHTRSRRVAIIGTPSTIQSGEYQRAIAAAAPDIEVTTKACPLFVPLAEEGWTSGPVPEAVAQTYLANLEGSGVDTLVLGCTHYPMLEEVISRVVGPSVTLVESGDATSDVVEQTLHSMGNAATTQNRPSHRFLVSDGPEAFVRIGRSFLQHPIDDVEWVDF